MASERRPRDEDFESAERLAQNSDEARRKIDAAAAKAERKRGRLGEAYDDLLTFFRMLRAYFDGSYRDVPTKAILLILAAIAYFLSPLDAIPDLVPFVGFTDDVGVLLFVANSAREHIERFRQWERRVR